MVALSVVEAANQDLARNGSRPYVAVFTGGTAGIGAYAVVGIATVFGKAKTTRGLRVYIVGRSQTAAETLSADCRTAYANGQYEFVKAADLSLLADVDHVCETITAAESAVSRKEGHAPRIDLLVATQGVLSLSQHQTAEGIDFASSLFYYGRMRVVDQLLPLLLSVQEDDVVNDTDDNPPGHVVSVFNPKLEGAIVESDLSLRKPENQGILVRGGQNASFTTFYMEALVSRYPGRIALAHYYPGYVVTDLANKSPLPRWVKILWRLVAPLLSFFSVPQAECGQRVLFMASSAYYPPRGTGSDSDSKIRLKTAVAGADGTIASGAYRLNWNGEAIARNKQAVSYRAKGMAETVYSYTQEEFALVVGETGNS
ncbi:short chain dehydrogenase reductase [Grosmannia clavigera kw1407]|uniref:Short chain dehydrogenase reductase n=1 Tax=Grosmannia clavigera (strain kw1407 / UAMH 11150) TaxID=655863 RepID=F0XF77_GROCL|nr:short chain dehydrogenase reductase [Grosmannia clavigera kw1407]EFX03829.1 short chain dehydrogenase reductase [Grosmannia clavigera kw1407]